MIRTTTRWLFPPGHSRCATSWSIKEGSDKLTDLTTAGDIVINHIGSIVFADGTIIGDWSLAGQYGFRRADHVFDLEFSASLNDSGGSESGHDVDKPAARRRFVGGTAWCGWGLSARRVGSAGPEDDAHGEICGPVAVVVTTATELALPGESTGVVATATAEAMMFGKTLVTEDLAQVEITSTDESDTRHRSGTTETGAPHAFA